MPTGNYLLKTLSNTGQEAHLQEILKGNHL